MDGGGNKENEKVKIVMLRIPYDQLYFIILNIWMILIQAG